MRKRLLTLMVLLVAIVAGAWAQNVNGHEYVDLGLPSGTLWATCNVGATTPEEYGDYFAWGEIEAKSDYSWATYKWGWYSYTGGGLTKYNDGDRKTVLDMEDDAARAKWGADWRMPTCDEIIELLDNTTKEWTYQNGVKGSLFTSNTNGNSIFLPASGIYNHELEEVGEVGLYWTSSLSDSWAASARYLYIKPDNTWTSSYTKERPYGLSVRPVISKAAVHTHTPGTAVKENETGSCTAGGSYDEVVYCTECGAEISRTNKTFSAGHDIVFVDEVAATVTSAGTKAHYECTRCHKLFADQTASIEITAEDIAIPKLPAPGLAIDATHFPDANFRAFLLEQGYGADGLLTDEEIASARSIYVDYRDIADLTGIELFTELTALRANNNQLTSIDLSKNTKLERLEVNSNQLTSLDVSNNTALWYLICDDNQLTTLDVSANTRLRTLYCSLNQLTSLDLSANTELEYLHCQGNQLSSLNIAGPKELASIECYWNKLQGEAMEKLINDLQDFSSVPGMDGYIRIFDKYDNDEDVGLFAKENDAPRKVAANKEEGNRVTREQFEEARQKGWSVWEFDGTTWVEMTSFVAVEPTEEIEVTLKTGKGLFDFTELENAALAAITYLVLDYEQDADENFIYSTKEGKELFTMTMHDPMQIIVADGVTAADNIVRELTAEDREVLSNVWSGNPETVSAKAFAPSSKTTEMVRLADVLASVKTITLKFIANLPAANHEYVDLGLPSGKLWATMNIGAKAPEEYGDFFAWGETATKEHFRWEDYTLADDDAPIGKWSKYCNNAAWGYNGFTDDLTELLPEDDAATQNWGVHWRTPTIEDYEELVANTTQVSATVGGVSGTKFVSKQDAEKYIFFPFTGYKPDYSGHYDSGVMGHYWARTYKYDSYGGGDQFRVQGTWHDTTVAASRWGGQTVRAIFDPTTGISSINNSQLTIDNSSAVYDLQGRKVADNPSSLFSHPSSKRGIYIVKGKKVVIK